MTANEYVELSVMCDIAKTDLDEAIVQGQCEENVAMLYRRYLALLTKKRGGIVNGLPDALEEKTDAGRV